MGPGSRFSDISIILGTYRSYFGLIFDDFSGVRRTCENGALAAVSARFRGFRRVKESMVFVLCFLDAKKRVSERVLLRFVVDLGGQRVPTGFQTGFPNDT